jgi:hypothetical protein
VQNNSTQYNYGGGVYNGSGGSATLSILSSTISGNHGYYAGGGIYNDASNGGSATLSIMNSIVSNNLAYFSEGYYNSGGAGGGIYNGGGTLMITNSIVRNNYAGAPDPFPVGIGGGIYNYGTLTITNSTINSNQVWLAGGGISSGGTLTITSSTTISADLIFGACVTAALTSGRLKCRRGRHQHRRQAQSTSAPQGAGCRAGTRWISLGAERTRPTSTSIVTEL